MSKAITAIPMLNLRDEYRDHKGEIDSAIARVLDTGVFIGGPEVSACEREIADFLGVKHAVALNSGTDALVIALRSLDITIGDEVITSPFSFFATAEAISLVGATPVFADICPETFNINPVEVEKKITSKTKAILPVHLFGLASNLSPLIDLAKKHNLYLVEDCAQSFGATYNDQMTGSFGDFGAYSFFPSKNLGCYGDGGLLGTNSDELALRAKKLASHGSSIKYHNEEIGYNSRLDSIQAAILRVKLKYVSANIKKRREIAQTYDAALNAIDGIVTPQPVAAHTFNQYTVRLRERRDEVRVALESLGISTAIYYPIPLHRQKPYMSQNSRMLQAETASLEVLSLPICPYQTPTMTKRIVACLQDSLGHIGRK